MKLNFLGILSLVALFAFTSCESDGTRKGSASFYLTDGPIESDNVTGVNITFTNVEVSGPEGWETIVAYDEPQTINLLDLQNGETFFLSETELPSGSYGQVRLGLLENDANAENLHNYISFSDGSTEAIKVPSGGQSGYKVVGGFTVPGGGVTAVTIDFDVRKSVVNTGSGKYLLKPTLRLLENSEVAVINGSINAEGTANFVVYAYADDAYSPNEETTNEDGLLFSNAVTSTNIDEKGEFTLAFLNNGTYDLYLASYDNQGVLIDINPVNQNIELTPGDIHDNFKLFIYFLSNFST